LGRRRTETRGAASDRKRSAKSAIGRRKLGQWPIDRLRPLRQEFEHAGLERPVADRKHMIAARNDEGPRAGG